MTVPQHLEGKHNDVFIKIIPQSEPNYWGNPMVWQMLLATGFFHCRFTIRSRKKEPYSMMYAYFQAISKNKTPELISQIRGIKIH